MIGGTRGGKKSREKGENWEVSGSQRATIRRLTALRALLLLTVALVNCSSLICVAVYDKTCAALC